MIPIHTVFLLLVVIFGLVGSLRGWAKETIVAFSVVLALFIEQVLTSMVPPIRDLWNGMPPTSRFWVQVTVFVLIVLFGYASPTLAQRIGARVARERLQDILLGFFLGLLNGILIVGTIWFYLDEIQYGLDPDQWREEQVVSEQGEPVVNDQGQPVTRVVYVDPNARGLGGIRPPERDSVAWDVTPYLPPRLIEGPPLYLAVGLSFVFVIIVFI